MVVKSLAHYLAMDLREAIGVDQITRPVITLFTGWSLFGVRAKYYFADTTEYYQVFATLRVPIGIIFLALTEKL